MAHEDNCQPITTWRRSIGEKCVAHDDKGRPIATWRRPIGEKGGKGTCTENLEGA